MDRASAGRIDIQIVSHGHGDCVQTLLDDIGRPGFRVFVLENLADAELAVANRAEVEILRNVSPVGFAENHNRLAALGKA